MEKALPPIPAKRYFTIGEVSELCGVKPYVLRYWEQEFTQLKPMKRRGNRRYYQHHEVLLIRRIRELLYEQGFTISGARNRLSDFAVERGQEDGALEGPEVEPAVDDSFIAPRGNGQDADVLTGESGLAVFGDASIDTMRQELKLIRELLSA
jgi:DNA-binding transcriptional MerR regulator